MTRRAALILAGGKARRFQFTKEQWQDKALAELFGKPLLVHAIENVQKVVDEVVVCTNTQTRKTQYEEVLTHYDMENVQIVVDEKISYIKGPNVAVLTGLKATKADYCFTLPCDMPLLKPEVVNYLFDAAGDAQVVVPMWPNSRLETLVMVLQRKAALEITDTLCQLRRPRSDDIMRGAAKILFALAVGEIKTLDPELKSFVNINSQKDFADLQTRRAQGPVAEDMRLNLGALLTPQLQQLREVGKLYNQEKYQEAAQTAAKCADHLEEAQSFFWAAVSRESEGEALLSIAHQTQTAETDFKGKEAVIKAADNYRLEAKLHQNNRIRFLAERATADRIWCESWAMGKYNKWNRYPPKTN
ncbi:MAG: molybdenum cofactor guanylyltransferase [Candidatus Bathyarchaeota archaeon]|nr:molybdenum cofactor guanylyltransferase [Candidatus Bathyarchaeota archaeon]